MLTFYPSIKMAETLSTSLTVLFYSQMIKQKATDIFVKSNKCFNFGVNLKLQCINRLKKWCLTFGTFHSRF